MKNPTPISSGWTGNINGHIEKTNSWIKVSEVTVRLDHDTAWALCNLLVPSLLNSCGGRVEREQIEKLLNVGAAIGQFIDHQSKENLIAIQKDGA